MHGARGRPVVAAAAAASTLSLALLGALNCGQASEPATARTSVGVAPPVPVEPPASGTTWPEPEVVAQRARCMALLSGLQAVATPLPPIKQGVCGTPAPVELSKLGRDPQVTFDPPVTVTCDMVAHLALWLKNNVQPLARQHLGAPITTIGTMSSYSCRNAYGRTSTNLSEHGLANAVDLGSFRTSSGELVSVLADWGMTGRDIAGVVASQKAASGKTVAAPVSSPAPTSTAVATPAPKPKVQAVAPAVAAALQPTPPAIAEPAPAVALRPALPPLTSHVPSLAVIFPEINKADPLMGFRPSKLGGPKAAAATPAIPEGHGSQPLSPPEAKALFLRKAHEAACHIFGTTLGPEANRDHRNHLHLDMAERKYKLICD